MHIGEAESSFMRIDSSNNPMRIPIADSNSLLAKGNVVFAVVSLHGKDRHGTGLGAVLDRIQATDVQLAEFTYMCDQ